MIVFYIIIIVFISIGLWSFIKDFKKAHTPGFKEVIGTVVDYKRRESTDSDGHISVSYSSIIEFEVNGVAYRHVRSSSSSWKQPLGKEVYIMYNPEDPTDNIVKNDFTGLVFVGIGFIFLIIVILL